MFIKIIKKKLINNILNKKNSKFLAEKLFKLNLKKLNKITKKNSKFIFYLAINLSLPVFELAKKKVKVKKVKLIKQKPCFIFENKNRILISIKKVTILYQISKFKEILSQKQINDNKYFNNAIILNKNTLKFYRWSN